MMIWIAIFSASIFSINGCNPNQISHFSAEIEFIVHAFMLFFVFSVRPESHKYSRQAKNQTIDFLANLAFFKKTVRAGQFSR
jgi:hypothetical protein